VAAGNGKSREIGPVNTSDLTNSRDVAAGIAILQEAGGLVTTANPPEDPSTAPIVDVRLGSRLYLAIR
jgi:fructose-1,6-bisphosphatase/inositol monophosphatase family enzyme